MLDTRNENEVMTIEDLTIDMPQLIEKADTITITNEIERQEATEFAVVLKRKFDDLEEARTKLVKPLNDHVKFINSQFKVHTSKLEDLQTKIKKGIGAYLLAEEKKAREEEEARLKAIKEENAKREEEGKAPVMMESVERPSTISRSETGGKTSAKKVWKFEVVDASQVPVEFLSPDIEKIKLAVSNGAREIAGVKIYEDMIVSTFKR